MTSEVLRISMARSGKESKKKQNKQSKERRSGKQEAAIQSLLNEACLGEAVCYLEFKQDTL